MSEAPESYRANHTTEKQGGLCMLSVVGQQRVGQSARCYARVALMQARLMQECGLTNRLPIKHRYQINEDNSLALPNLLNRQFNPAAPNRV